MREVLGRMRRAGRLDAELERVAASADLDLVPPTRPFGAPHLVTDLAGKLETLGLDRAVEVRTTLDPALQRDVERSVRSELAADPRLGQAAVLVIDNASGDVLAYVGSADFLDVAGEGQNDGVRARRQPGSALKPFAYGLALASGWTPASVLSDVDLEVGTAGGAWLPRNYDRRQHGPVRLRAALANSYNVPAVELTDSLGPERVLEVLRQAGFTSLEASAEHYGAGLVLGNGDVSLWELARAYRGLARGGVVEPLRLVRSATDRLGDPVAGRPELAARRFLPADAVALLTDLLSDETARAPAFGLDNALRLPFPVAAKTGTSRAYVDNWTVGFTRERTVAVWVGNFDGRPMQRVSGITGAGPLFGRVMRRAMAGVRPAPLVDRERFQRVRICPLSGHRASEACPGSHDEVFLPGTAPAEPCTMHRLAEGRRVLALDARYTGWAERERLEVAAGEGGGATEPPGFITPRDGDEFLVEAGIPASSQTIPVRVRGAGQLRVDGTVAPLDPLRRTRLALAPGVHRLELWPVGPPPRLQPVEHRRDPGPRRRPSVVSSQQLISSLLGRWRRGRSRRRAALRPGGARPYLTSTTICVVAPESTLVVPTSRRPPGRERPLEGRVSGEGDDSVGADRHRDRIAAPRVGRELDQRGDAGGDARLAVAPLSDGVGLVLELPEAPGAIERAGREAGGGALEDQQRALPAVGRRCHERVAVGRERSPEGRVAGQADRSIAGHGGDPAQPVGGVMRRVAALERSRHHRDCEPCDRW